MKENCVETAYPSLPLFLSASLYVDFGCFLSSSFRVSKVLYDENESLGVHSCRGGSLQDVRSPLRTINHI